MQTKTEAKAVLPPIPAKRYFTIGEVSDLCGVKPHVLRYWEQEFTQLRPMKRRGNRRYYQHHEVLLVRRIRELLYEQGFTISGARNRLGESVGNARGRDAGAPVEPAVRMLELPAADVDAIRAELSAAFVLLGGTLPDPVEPVDSSAQEGARDAVADEGVAQAD